MMFSMLSIDVAGMLNDPDPYYSGSGSPGTPGGSGPMSPGSASGSGSPGGSQHGSGDNQSGTYSLGKVIRPTIFFYLAVAVVGAKISLGRNISIFMKRETLQKRHKQSNKHVFRVCMHSYMYITKVT